MVQGIFSNVTAEKLIQRGFKASTEGLRQGVTKYSKVLPIGGTEVSYFIENSKCISKEIRPGTNTYARNVNNIGFMVANEKNCCAFLPREHFGPGVVLKNKKQVKIGLAYLSQLYKEGYDKATRFSAIERFFG